MAGLRHGRAMYITTSMPPNEHMGDPGETKIDAESYVHVGTGTDRSRDDVQVACPSRVRRVPLTHFRSQPPRGLIGWPGLSLEIRGAV